MPDPHLTVSPHVLEQFIDVSDAMAFLADEYGTTADDIVQRRRDELDHIVESWCQQHLQEDAVATLVSLRGAKRGGEVAHVPTTKKPAKRQGFPKPPAEVAQPLVCPDCGKTCASALGLSIHQAKTHGQAGVTRTPGKDHQCPDCSFASTTPNGLTRHRRQQHGAAYEPPVETAADPTPIPVPGFDGHHRLAHERRVGHDIDAYCACGDSSGPTDREDARAWLHQHIDTVAA